MTWYKCPNGNWDVPHQCNTQCAALNNAVEVNSIEAQAWWKGYNQAKGELRAKLQEAGFFDDGN